MLWNQKVERIKKAYPEALAWGSKNIDQQAAFQAMWLASMPPRSSSQEAQREE
jgi:hypothetical protein